jgi:hypothetical protein
MTHERSSDYLWDRSGPVDPVVAELEQRLSVLAHQRPLAAGRAESVDASPRRPWSSAAAPIVSSAARVAPTPRRGRRWLPAMAMAALAALALWQFLAWRLTWPVGEAWPVRDAAPLIVGEPRTFDEATGVVAVARLGDLRPVPGTTVTLRATGSRWHALDLARGALDVRLWAPPGLVRVRTPAGDVIDLGCVFRVDVEDSGVARVRVDSGWVQLDNPHGESLVPAGASSLMRADARPRVAVFDDAPAAFRAGVRDFESGGETAGATRDGEALARAFSVHARRRDMLTLLTLAARSSGETRAVLVTRAAALAPPPEGISVAAVAGGDDGPLWAWVDALPLPPAKGWWRNWRDAFPRAVR